MTPDQYYGFIVVFLAVCVGLLTAKIASDKGGSFVLWFVAGAFLAIVALPLAIFLSQEQIAPRHSRTVLSAPSGSSGRLVCKHCRYEFTAHDDLRIT